jgi:hypothetical protein
MTRVELDVDWVLVLALEGVSAHGNAVHLV